MFLFILLAVRIYILIIVFIWKTMCIYHDNIYIYNVVLLLLKTVYLIHTHHLLLIYTTLGFYCIFCMLHIFCMSSCIVFLCCATMYVIYISIIPLKLDYSYFCSISNCSIQVHNDPYCIAYSNILL